MTLHKIQAERQALWERYNNNKLSKEARTAILQRIQELDVQIHKEHQALAYKLLAKYQ